MIVAIFAGFVFFAVAQTGVFDDIARAKASAEQQLGYDITLKDFMSGKVTQNYVDGIFDSLPLQ